ncbi:MAG: S9 family peptidase [Sphingomonadaceae bacterium]|nr:S9 family peptidase [Sphingomonadaceae bacterium]
MNRASRGIAALALVVFAQQAAAQTPPMPFTVEDMTRVEEISEPVFAPDGERVVYVVSSARTDKDASQSDLFAVGWEGGAGRALTRTRAESEWSPQFSADGRVLAFLRDGGDDEEGETQLWTMAERGGRARQASRIAGGVSDYSLSPDGRSAVVVAELGGAVGSEADPPAPIVIDRLFFKEDGRGRLDARRQHLFRVDLRSGEAVQLTSGEDDHWLPSWSPDGRWIAFVSKRCEDADRHLCHDIYVMPAEGGEARRISTHEGSDLDPDWEAGRPEWSPDSRRLLWVAAGEERLIYYSPFQLATADIESGEQGAPARIDRWFYGARWDADGRHILALIEQDRDTWLARIDPVSNRIEYLTSGARMASDFALGEGGRIVVLDGDVASAAGLRTVEATPRTFGEHNGWLAERAFGETRDVSFMSGDVEIHALLTLPPGHAPGTRLPLIVRLHGGPVYQFSHELNLDWQVYAARGYAVLAVNPRGSSGRGEAFASAIYADWGNADAADISAGIDWAIAEGIADPARIGVAGWSYGGILANYMIAREPRVRAAVSGAGMANFAGGYGADQYVREYEIELGPPWQQADLWRRLSYPFWRAGEISAATLYLCAAEDVNVPCIGAEQMYQALRSRGVPTRLVVYPGETHGLSVPSYIRDRVTRHLDWFDRHLAVQ